MIRRAIVLAALASLLLNLVNSNQVWAENTWYLGKNLLPGDKFTYKICDPLLSIKLKTKDICYTVKLHFQQIVKNHSGKSWITQVQVEHNSKIMNSTMQISTLTFQARSDYSTKTYAESIQRTLFYLNQYANAVAEKPLTIGATWGDVAAYAAYGAKMVVRQLKTMEVADAQLETYKIGYEIMKESTVYLVDNFPFPVKAKVYEPTLAYPEPPLKYEIELVSIDASSNA